jgi:hypothetical protein
MNDLSIKLSQIVKQGIEYNSDKIFPTNDDKKYVSDFIQKLLKKNSVFYCDKNAINHYLNQENLSFPIEIYSKNVKKDSINIGKYICKKFKNVLVKAFDNQYKIFWEGKYDPVVIIYYFNLDNKNKTYIDLKYLLMKMFYEFSLPREYLNQWKDNLKTIDNLLKVSKINVKNKKIKHNSNYQKMVQVLESEKNFFYSGMQYLKFHKIINEVEYLDIYALEPQKIIKKLKDNFKGIKLEKQKTILNFIPEAQIVKINKKICAKIYPIDKCYSHTGYYANIFNVLLLIINFEPGLFKNTIKHYQQLEAKFKYQGMCLGPLPKPTDKISSKLIFSCKKNN